MTSFVAIIIIIIIFTKRMLTFQILGQLIVAFLRIFAFHPNKCDENEWTCFDELMMQIQNLFS